MFPPEPPDELGDVIPMGVTIGISDGVNEMWMGRRISDIQGYGENGWTPEQMLDYFTDLCRVYDAWNDSKAPWLLPENINDLVLPEDLRSGGFGGGVHDLRNFVAKCYDHYEIGMVALLAHLNVTPTMWVKSVSGTMWNDTKVLDDEGVAEIESYYTQIHPPYDAQELMHNLSLSRSTVRHLCAPFKRRRVRIHGEEALKVDRAPEMLRQLVEESHHKTPTILRMVHEATGVLFTKSYASKIRVRARAIEKK